MKTLPRPIADYTTYEELMRDYIRTDQYLSLTKEQRVPQLDRLRDVWTVKHAQKAESLGATDKDLTGKAMELVKQIIDLTGTELTIDPTTGRIVSNRGPGLVGKLIESQLPEDNIQAVIDLAFFGVGPEAVAGKAAYRILMGGPLRRIAAGALAGAVGGATEGRAGEGAIRGGFEAAGGEATMGLLKFGGYEARKRVLPNLDFDRVAGWLESRFGRKIPDMPTLRKLFYEGGIVNDTEATFNRVQGQVAKKLGKNFRLVVKVPSSGGQTTLPIDMTLDEAVNHLKIIEDHGWKLRGNPNMTASGAMARDAAHELEGDIASQIDAKNKQAGIDWYTAHGRLKEAKALRNLFASKGVLTDDGFDMPTLQNLISRDDAASHKYSLLQSMGDQSYESFRNMAFRGAPTGSLTDRPGAGPIKSLRLYFHGLSGHPQLPYPARHVGDTPFKFGDNRILRAVATVGPYGLLQHINDMSSLPPTSIKQESASALPPTSIKESPEPIRMTITKTPAEMRETIAKEQAGDAQ